MQADEQVGDSHEEERVHSYGIVQSQGGQYANPETEIVVKRPEEIQIPNAIKRKQHFDCDHYPVILLQWL